MSWSAEAAGEAMAGAALRARGLLRAAIDVVMPPLALDRVRGAGPMQSPGLSAEAWTKIAFLETPVCDGCGAPQAYDAGPDARCPACLARKRAPSTASAPPSATTTPRADLILKLKRADRTDLAGLFALWLSRAAGALIEDADAVIRVPLHPTRMRCRLVNQAAEIDRPLARLAGLPFLPDVLIRRRDPARARAAARPRAGGAACRPPSPRRRGALAEGGRQAHPADR